MYLPKLFPVIFAYTTTLLLTADRSNGHLNEDTLSVFQDGNQSYFNHLVADEQGRWVYVDAVDYLYQLSSDLKLQIKHPMPQPKSSNCSSSSPNCSKEAKRKYINDNQVLVLDHRNQQLISCSTNFSGLCHAHDTKNISNTMATGPDSEVQRETDSAQPIAAFIAPTLLGNSSTPTSVLHVAYAIRSDQPDKFALMMTARNAQREHFLSHLGGDNITYYHDFKRPTYGFNDGNSSYFLVRGDADPGLLIDSQEKKSAALVMKIDQENGNYSYSKFFLTCDNYFQKYNSSSTEHYNAKLKKAYIYENKQELHSKSETPEKVLFTLFETYVDSKNKSNRADGFAVCMHRMNELHNDYRYVNKSEVVDGDLVYSHKGSNIVPTGIAVTSVNNYIVLLIGAQTGHLYKISVKGFDSPDATTANNYADTAIDERSAINSDILYNSTMNHIYAMTKEKIVKIKMYNCEKYNTLDSCLLARDPHCGWCSPGGKCSTKTECIDNDEDSDKWSSIDPQPNSGIIVIPNGKIITVFFLLVHVQKLLVLQTTVPLSIFTHEN